MLNYENSSITEAFSCTPAFLLPRCLFCVCLSVTTGRPCLIFMGNWLFGAWNWRPAGDTVEGQQRDARNCNHWSMSSIFFPLSPFPFSYCVLFIYYFVHSFCSNETLSSQQPRRVSHIFGISLSCVGLCSIAALSFPFRARTLSAPASRLHLWKTPVQFPARLQWWIYIISMTANVGLNIALQSFESLIFEQWSKNVFFSSIRKPLKTFKNLNDAII